MKTIDNQILLYRKSGNSTIVSFANTNRLNAMNSNEIENELLHLIKNGEKSIFLDFSQIQFIDSDGFHALLSVYIDAKLGNVEFIIIDVKQEVLELFRLVELDKIFDIKSSSNYNLTNFRKAS